MDGTKNTPSHIMATQGNTDSVTLMFPRTHSCREANTDPPPIFTDTLICSQAKQTLSCTDLPEIHTQISAFQICALTHTNTNTHHAFPQKHANPHLLWCPCQQPVQTSHLPVPGPGLAEQLAGRSRHQATSPRERNNSSSRWQRVRDLTCGTFSPTRPGGISRVCQELLLANKGQGACPRALFHKANSSIAPCCNFPLAFPLGKLTSKEFI